MHRVKLVNNQATIKTAGKVLVLPTGDNTRLPTCNEYVLNSNRLTVAESPFGGLKGAAPPDYGVGTVAINTGDGVYLQDINGNNTGKILTAGKLKEVNSLTVDTSAKTITEEFIIENTNTNNASYSICNCDATNYWSSSKGTLVLDTTNKQEGSGCISNTATTATDVGSAYNPIGIWDLSAYDFLTLWIKGVNSKIIQVILKTDDANYGFWNTTANGNWQRLVLPLKKPAGKVGSLNLSSVDFLIVYTLSAVIGDVCLIDDIRADVGKPCYLEINTPDYLADTSLQIQVWNSTLGTPAYEMAAIRKLDGQNLYVNGDATKFKLLDGTTFDDVYGVAFRRDYYPKGISGNTYVGISSSSITYSAQKGTKFRIGLAFVLPPSDNGRTSFNKIRLKLIIYYTLNSTGKYASTYEFSDSLNLSYGLQNLIRPWVAVYDPVGSVLDVYLFTRRPTALNRKKDDTGKIYEIAVTTPGQVYHERIVHYNPALDSNSNLIPNCLEMDVEGAVGKLFAAWGFSQDGFLEYDLSTSAITTNDFSITAGSLNIIPFAVSEGDKVTDTNNAIIPVSETVATASGNVSILDVRGKTAVRVRDTAFTNGGDCKVFDTAGQSDENNWKRVYTTDWVFAGDTVIENGIFRIKITAAQKNIIFYVWNGSSYIYVHTGSAATDIYLGTSILNYSITSNSPDLIQLAITSYESPTTYTINFTLRRGRYGFTYAVSPTRNTFLYPSTRFFIADTVYDCRLSTASTYTSSISILDIVSFSPTSTCLFYMGSAIGTKAAMNSADQTYFSYLRNPASTLNFIGAIPFDCSKLYYEAETCAVYGNDYLNIDDSAAGAYPPGSINAKKCSQRWSGIYILNNAIWGSGTYSVYVRCRSETSADLVGYALWDTTTSESIASSGNLSVGTSYQYVNWTFTIAPSRSGHHFNLYIEKKTADANGIIFDYALIIPTGIIEKYARWALWNPAPFTTTYKIANR